ncbi:unnamed protein product [Effrenium voratum]|nr:unnamed protein product [Effrenium voratum]
MASRFCWPSLNILGVTVYGWSPGPTWPRAHQHTQDLLQHLTEQLVFGSSGARYISGDFNGCPNTLPAFHLWEQAGWCEVQDLHRLRTGEPPRMTCKGVSRPDRIYVSPELALLFQQTMVQSGFADHEALTASFRIPEVNQMVLSWPLPGALPWDDICIQDWAHYESEEPPGDIRPGHETEFYKNLGAEYEDSATVYLRGQQRLPPHHRGRAQALKPRLRPPQMPALRASREGEEAPASSFINRQLQRWFKQLRRIQSLKHNIHAAGQHAAAIEYRLYLWQAIKVAKGFDGPFDYWWLQRPHQRQSAPGYLPEDIPAANVIEEIFEDFRTNYRNLEAWHLRQRQRALRVEYREQAKKAFQAVKGKEFHSMDHLVSYHYADILHVDAQTSEVLVDHALPEATNGLWFDLWEQTSQFLEMMYPGQLSVVHVSSHQAESDSPDPLTDWIIFWKWTTCGPFILIWQPQESGYSLKVLMGKSTWTQTKIAKPLGFHF